MAAEGDSSSAGNIPSEDFVPLSATDADVDRLGAHLVSYRLVVGTSLGLLAFGLSVLFAGEVGMLVLNLPATHMVSGFGSCCMTMAVVFITTCPTLLLDLEVTSQKRPAVRLSIAGVVILFHMFQLTFSAALSGVERRDWFTTLTMLVCTLLFACGWCRLAPLAWQIVLIVISYGITLCLVSSHRAIPTWHGMPLRDHLWLGLGIFLLVSALIIAIRWVLSKKVPAVLAFYDSLYDLVLVWGLATFVLGVMVELRTPDVAGGMSTMFTGVFRLVLAALIFIVGRDRIYRGGVFVLSWCHDWLGRVGIVTFKFAVGFSFGLVAFVCIAGVSLRIYQYIPSSSDSSDGYPVVCRTVMIRELAAPHNARICFPDVANQTFSMFLFAHGDGAGGYLFDVMYHQLQVQIAAQGFVVPAYLSCWFDSQCTNGETSFLEALKTIDYVKQHHTSLHLNTTLPYTISGHSTGGRVALMLGAMKDRPEYLAAVQAALSVKITPSMRESIGNITAIVAYHPDPMDQPALNPSVGEYSITDTPVFILTGTKDSIEDEGSAWEDFRQVTSMDKIFVNVDGAEHFDKASVKLAVPFMADFAKRYTLGNTSMDEELCGAGSVNGSLRSSLNLAPRGAKNNGRVGSVRRGPVDDSFAEGPVINSLGRSDVSFLCCRAGHEPSSEWVDAAAECPRGHRHRASRTSV